MSARRLRASLAAAALAGASFAVPQKRLKEQKKEEKKEISMRFSIDFQ